MTLVFGCPTLSGEGRGGLNSFAGLLPFGFDEGLMVLFDIFTLSGALTTRF
jgi:hypothetical protein